ncbi:unnamed protein product [Schistocephalus solidus]|uniref:Anaphase-promoting complex subunit 1 n=1 Tax=Schistocephalus solidus TaxID=70667 RepID=A0A183T147_SCHSO|nr:unnamed protein product [Schistocephalus solidus]
MKAFQISPPTSPLLDASRLLDFSHYKELAFFPTLGQSSIYSLTVLPSRPSGRMESPSGKYDIIAACLLSATEYSSTKQRCNVYSFTSDGGCLKPMNKPIDFVYLPIADIVCIRALYDYTSEEYLAGLYFAEYEETSVGVFPGLWKSLSFSYFLWANERSTAFIHPGLCSTWRLQKLQALPIQSFLTAGFSNTLTLSPTAIILAQTDLGPQDPLVLSSSPPDQSVTDSVSSNDGLKSTEASDSATLGRQASHLVNKVYGELDIASAVSLFPELKCVSASMVTYMDFVMLKTDPPVRLSAFGCIDGWFGVGMTDISKPVLLHFFSGSHDSPITCVKLFKQFPEPSPHPLGSQGLHNVWIPSLSHLTGSIDETESIRPDIGEVKPTTGLTQVLVPKRRHSALEEAWPPIKSTFGKKHRSFNLDPERDRVIVVRRDIRTTWLKCEPIRPELKRTDSVVDMPSSLKATPVAHLFDPWPRRSLLIQFDDGQLDLGRTKQIDDGVMKVVNRSIPCGCQFRNRSVTCFLRRTPYRCRSGRCVFRSPLFEKLPANPSSTRHNFLFRNVYTCQHFGSDNQAVLHGSADFDHVNCACVGDLDFDGRPEIVIGTFGQQLLLYRWVTDEERTSDSVVAVAAAADKASLPGRYECVSRRTVAGQVHSLLYGYDFLGDGCLCLAVLTSQGLQVLQCKSETVMDLLERRLDCLLADSKL